jgi:hypothetical protein
MKPTPQRILICEDTRMSKKMLKEMIERETKKSLFDKGEVKDKSWRGGAKKKGGKVGFRRK